MQNKLEQAQKNKIFYQRVREIIDSLTDTKSRENNQSKTGSSTYRDELVPYLASIRADILGAFAPGDRYVKCRFSVESLLTVVNLAKQKKCPVFIYQAINELHQIIVTDIKTPAPEGGHFNYQGFSGDQASEIINVLYENDKNIPAGEMLWRVCLGLNPSHAAKFIETHAELISKIRKLSTYQSFRLFTETSHEFVLDNPWLLAFFTPDQLTKFIEQPLSDRAKKHTTIQSLITTVSYDSESTASTNEPYFLSRQGTTPDQLLFKKSLIRFVTFHHNYSRQVINESVATIGFIFSCGVIKEFLALTNPSIIVDLFLEMERIIIPELVRDDKLKAASDLRAFPEYTWLYERIIQDLSNGDDAYFAKVITIPYILYYLVGLTEFYSISKQQLAAFLGHIDFKIILQTLRLLDEYETSESYGSLAIHRDRYPVNKQFTKQIYQNFAALLLSDEFLSLRESWLQKEKTQKILVRFPFLLKGVDPNTVKTFIQKKMTKIMTNAKNCINNGVNPYRHCPYLLEPLNTQEVINLYKLYPDVQELFKKQILPIEIIVSYIKRGMLEALIKEIPSLENYLQPAYFKQINPTLLDEALLTEMTRTEITRKLLKNYPSLLGRFNKRVISACSQVRDAIFLRQILRQEVIVHLLLDNFDYLLRENLSLLNSMVQVLYRNPETQVLVEKIEQMLKTKRNFNGTPYSLTDTFSEQSTLQEILGLVLGYQNEVKKLKVNNPDVPDQELAAIKKMMTVGLKIIDPVIYILKVLIDSNPSWARRLIHSGGFYHALKQFSLQILRISVDNLKSNNNNHYSTIYQYATLKMEEGEYEEAADFFVEHMTYLGINCFNHRVNEGDQLETNGNSFHYLLICANNLVNGGNLTKAVYYYHCLALTLLAASPVQLTHARISQKNLEAILAGEIIEQLKPVAIVVRARCYWLEMAIELAAKCYELIQKNLLQEQRLIIISCMLELLGHTIKDDFCTELMREQALTLQKQFIAASNQTKDQTAETYHKKYSDLIRFNGRKEHFKEMEDRGITTAIKQRLDSVIESPKTSMHSLEQGRISFSPYSKVKDIDEMKQVTANVKLNLPRLGFPRFRQKTERTQPVSGQKGELKNVDDEFKLQQQRIQQEKDALSGSLNDIVTAINQREAKRDKVKKEVRPVQDEDRQKRLGEETSGEEKIKQQEQAEKDSLNEAWRKAKEIEQQHRASFDQKDRQKRIAKEAEERRKNHHARNLSAGALTSFDFRSTSLPLEKDSKNIVNSGMQIKQRPTPPPVGLVTETEKGTSSDSTPQLRRSTSESSLKAQLNLVVPKHEVAPPTPSHPVIEPSPSGRDHQLSIPVERRVTTGTVAYRTISAKEIVPEIEEEASGSFTSAKAVTAFFTPPPKPAAKNLVFSATINEANVIAPPISSENPKNKDSDTKAPVPEKKSSGKNLTTLFSNTANKIKRTLSEGSLSLASKASASQQVGKGS